MVAYERVSIGFGNAESASSALIRLGYSPKLSQRLIDRGRLFCDFNSAGVVQAVKSKSEPVSGELFLLRYVPRPRGLRPIFECDDFGVFDKPSGVLSHPNGRGCEYSLYDEIYELWGENACVAHRLDRDTSGLIIVAKNAVVARELKLAFETRVVRKQYVSMLRGRVDKNALLKAGLVCDMVDFRERFFDIFYKNKFLNSKNKPLKYEICGCELEHSSINFKTKSNKLSNWSDVKNLNSIAMGLENLNKAKIYQHSKQKMTKNCNNSSDVNKYCIDKILATQEFDFAVVAPLKLISQDGVSKIKMGVSMDGKPSATLVRVLDYLPEFDATIVLCEPLTGRQHQIRVHMFHMKHHILGDPLYGVSNDVARAILDGEISGADRTKATGWHRLCLHASWIKFSFAGREYELDSGDYRRTFGL